jgi:hypothetical protein
MFNWAGSIMPDVGDTVIEVATGRKFTCTKLFELCIDYMEDPVYAVTFSDGTEERTENQGEFWVDDNPTYRIEEQKEVTP